jgi:hypothetical protein
MTALLAAALVVVSPVSLWRGGPGDSDFRYWAVADTFVDKGVPKANYGRDRLLSAGPGKRILLRFGDLDRFARGRRVASASLRLKVELGSGEARLTRVATLRRPWREGAGRRGLGAPRMGPDMATWENLADRDGTPVREASARFADGWTTIQGLGGAVQAMLDAPLENHGLVLEFGQVVDFASSDARDGRPRLDVAFEETAAAVSGPDLEVVAIDWEGDSRPAPGRPARWVATIRNSGTARAEGFEALWRIGDRDQAPLRGEPLEPGQRTTLSIEAPMPAVGQPDALRMTVLARGDMRRSNDALAIGRRDWPAATTLERAETAARRLATINENVLGGARFSFVPDGVRGRFRLALKGESGWADAASLRESAAALIRQTLNLTQSYPGPDLFPGLTGFGDTRDETRLPGAVPLLYEPWPDDPLVEEAHLEPSDGLSLTEAALLARSTGREPVALTEALPKAAILSVLDAAGEAAKLTEFELVPWRGGAYEESAMVKLKVGRGGTVRLPVEAFAGGAAMLRARQRGTTTSGVVTQWQIVDAAARLDGEVAFLNLRLNLPPAPIDTSVDIALDKLVTDSTNALPAQLVRLTDGRPETVWTAPSQPGWVEIDLGRDRAIGEVRLDVEGASIWERFQIMIHATGQTAASARVFAAEVAGAWRLRQGPLIYRGMGIRGRFVRLVYPASPSTVRLRGVAVFALEAP